MPVSPKDAKAHVTKDEEAAFRELCNVIDGALKDSYQGFKMKLNLPTHKGFTRRVAERLRDEYKKAGWGQVHVYEVDRTIELDPSEPRYSSAWD